ncbi:MAG TPA: DUF4266 domain-containing protein, partial [Byssovorax sp.]
TCTTTRANTISSRLMGLFVMVVALGVGAGCSSVAPYERAKLAHPTMAVADGATFGEMHVRAIHEGAIGGSAGAGSGCGCN